MSQSSVVRPAPSARPSVWFGRALAYLAAAVLFAALALAPALLAIGLAGRTNPLGYLAAAAWCVMVGLVVWGFGSAAHGPSGARQGKAGDSARALRRTRRFIRHHRYGLRRRVNRPALLAAAGVAVVLTVAMIQAWT
jgi:hypothetical protein